MENFSKHEIEFFKRLRETGKNIDSEALKFSIFILFIFATLFVIPLLNFIN